MATSSTMYAPNPKCPECKRSMTKDKRCVNKRCRLARFTSLPPRQIRVIVEQAISEAPAHYTAAQLDEYILVRIDEAKALTHI